MSVAAFPLFLFPLLEVADHRLQNLDALPCISEGDVAARTQQLSNLPGLVAVVDREPPARNRLVALANGATPALGREHLAVLTFGNAVALPEGVIPVPGPRLLQIVFTIASIRRPAELTGSLGVILQVSLSADGCDAEPTEVSVRPPRGEFGRQLISAASGRRATPAVVTPGFPGHVSRVTEIMDRKLGGE